MEMEKATLDLWKPGGKEYEVTINIRNSDPKAIIAHIMRFSLLLEKEFIQLEKVTGDEKPR